MFNLRFFFHLVFNLYTPNIMILLLNFLQQRFSSVHYSNIIFSSETNEDFISRGHTVQHPYMYFNQHYQPSLTESEQGSVKETKLSTREKICMTKDKNKKEIMLSPELLCLWTWFIVQYSKNSRTHFRNWICFHP
jgi:hypothetical protein